MSTSSNVIFTNRLYLTGLAGEEERGYLHFSKGGTPVFTGTSKRTQQTIASLLDGMNKPFGRHQPERLGPLARLEIIWHKNSPKPAYSGLLAYDMNGNLLFHAREARVSGGSNGQLLRCILLRCGVSEDMVTAIFETVPKENPKDAYPSHSDSYAIVVSRERLDRSGKPTGKLTRDRKWRRGLANKALAALQKV